MKNIKLIFAIVACFISVSLCTEKYVVFRLDDIQDYWLTDAQQAVINVFKDQGLPMTIGIIANKFGEDSEIVDYVESCLEDSSFGVEIANHGWNHEDFETFTESQQETLLSEAKQKTVAQLSDYISDITTFIPPFDQFNDDTITALQATGYTIISSDISFYGCDEDGKCDDKGRAYPGEVAGFYELPAGSGTNDLYDEYVISVDESLSLIQTQISNAGFAVVMMHFNWYSFESEDGTTSVNQTMIEMLQQLVTECQNAGYTLTTLRGIADSLAGNSPTSGNSGSTTTKSSTGSHSTSDGSSSTGSVGSTSTTGSLTSSTTGSVGSSSTSGSNSGSATTGSTQVNVTITTGSVQLGNSSNVNVSLTSTTTGRINASTSTTASSSTSGSATCNGPSGSQGCTCSSSLPCNSGLSCTNGICITSVKSDASSTSATYFIMVAMAVLSFTVSF